MEESSIKAARLQGVRDKARGNLIQGIMVGEGEKLSGMHVNSQAFYVEDKRGCVYVAREQNVTLIKVARVGIAEGSLLARGTSAGPAVRREDHVQGEAGLQKEPMQLAVPDEEGNMDPQGVKEVPKGGWWMRLRRPSR